MIWMWMMVIDSGGESDDDCGGDGDSDVLRP